MPENLETPQLPLSLKLDRTKLKTAKTYAGMKQVSLQTVYDWMADKKVRVEEIDGVKFIHI